MYSKTRARPERSGYMSSKEMIWNVEKITDKLKRKEKLTYSQSACCKDLISRNVFGEMPEKDDIKS